LDGYFASARQSESAGDDAARNPRSTATGRYQFLSGTWDDLMRRHPQLGLTPDGRMDPAQQERAMRAFTADNMAHLARAGIEATPGTLYAAHFLGAGGATSVLRQPDGARVADIVPAAVITANPHLRDMTVAEFRGWADRQGSRTGSAPTSRQGSANMPLTINAAPAPAPTQGSGRERRWYQDPAIWEALQLGFNSMRLNPDPSLASVVNARQTRRSEQEEREAQRAAQTMTLNQAVSFLQQNGAPAHLVQAVSQGLIPPEAAVQFILTPPEQPRGIAVGGSVVNPVTGEVIYQGPEGGRHELITGEAAAALGLNPNHSYNRGPDGRIYQIGGGGTTINMPQIGSIPPGYTVEYDDQGNPVQMAPIPGGPVDADRQSDAASREAQTVLTERQLGPTLDDIVTARDLAENGIGTTGMLSGIIRRIPVVGQGALDMAATIDAIGAGISLENLNQMRQASPTGGALGNVSDRQSALLSSAFGSLQQSQSRELFLYNLARVENTLNDIVHGPDGGPPRHDMERLRRQLRGGGTGQAPAQPGPAQSSPAPQGQSRIPSQGPITAAMVRDLPDADLLTVDIMRLDEEALTEYERRRGLGSR
jgi:hypothetical protein